MEWKFLKELKIFLAGKGFITKFKGDAHANSILVDAVAVSPEKFTPQIYHEVTEYLNNSGEYMFKNIKFEADADNWHIKFSFPAPEVYHVRRRNERTCLEHTYIGFNGKDAILSVATDIVKTAENHTLDELFVCNGNEIHAVDERGSYYWECDCRDIYPAELREIIRKA